MNREVRTGFIDDLRNCKRCGSLEHENYLRDDLCPNCYYDVGRFKEEREKAKADNKWLNKWQKLKEWGMSFLKDCDIIFDKSKKDSYLYNSALHHKKILIIMLAKMQELEGEDEI